MKKILNLAFFIMLMGCLAVSCSNRDENTTPAFDESKPHPFSILQISELYKMIGAEEGVFKQKLKEQNVPLEEKVYGNWNQYYATNPASPFKKYRIEFIDTEYNVHYNPIKKYKGTSWIRIHPINEDGTDAKEADFKKVFDYFYSRLNALEPSKKPYQLWLYNAALQYEEMLPDYETFIKELGNPRKEVNGEIIWNNNPEPSMDNSTKEKNTPIMRLRYTKTEKEPKYTIEICSNIPWELN